MQKNTRLGLWLNNMKTCERATVLAHRQANFGHSLRRQALYCEHIHPPCLNSTYLCYFIRELRYSSIACQQAQATFEAIRDAVWKIKLYGSFFAIAQLYSMNKAISIIILKMVLLHVTIQEQREGVIHPIILIEGLA